MAEPLYLVANEGCDDTTLGIVRIADEDFTKLKAFIENLNKNSTYGCMPTIDVYRINDSFIKLATDDDSKDGILYMDDGKYVLKKYLYECKFVDHSIVTSLSEGVERVV